MAWYDLAWSQRKKITINGSKTIESGVYPVFITWSSDSDLDRSAQINGADILFTDGDGVTKLPHEIEYFNPDTGGLAAWVRVPLEAGVDKEIYMYYHNRNCGNQEAIHAVWGSDNVLVQHLEEPTGQTCEDSTQQGNDGMPTGDPAQTEGLCDGCLSFSSGRYVEVPDAVSLRPLQLTVIAVVKLNQTPSGECPLVDKQNWGNQAGYTLFFSDDSLCFRILDGATNYTADWVYDYNTGEWHVIAGTFNEQTVKLYSDGALKNSVDAETSISHDATSLVIGKDGWNGAFNGLIDEVRVLNATKSEGWLRTTANNLKDPASFFSVDSAEYSSLWKYTYRGLSLEEAHAIYR